MPGNRSPVRRRVLEMPAEQPYTRREFLAAGSGLTGVSVFGSEWLNPAPRPVHVHIGYRENVDRSVFWAAARGPMHDFEFNVVTVRIAERDIPTLLRQPGVRYVEPVQPVSVLADPVSASLDAINVQAAHDRGFRGAGADVGIVDTGISNTHDALAASLGDGTAYVAAESPDQPDWIDNNGHGSNCAGLIGATSEAKGVAPAATLHSVKAFNHEGNGTTEHAASGIEYAVKQGWAVVNLSFGAPKTQALIDACQYAWDHGVVLVGAAGYNSGTWPAKAEECIGVGATTGDGEIAEFSPTGSVVDVVAPGVEIRSTAIEGYDDRSGTSMAAAHVSGAAALLAAQGHGPGVVRERLQATAQALEAEEAAQGAGLLDVGAALTTDPDDESA